MERSQIAAFMELAQTVHLALADLPYKVASSAIKAVDEMRDIVGEGLPGGWGGFCPGCDEVVGEDELQDCGDERLCKSCFDRLQKD